MEGSASAGKVVAGPCGCCWVASALPSAAWPAAAGPPGAGGVPASPTAGEVALAGGGTRLAVLSNPGAGALFCLEAYEQFLFLNVVLVGSGSGSELAKAF